MEAHWLCAALMRRAGGEGEEGSQTNKVVRQFAPQTGIGGGGGMDVDRHM